MPNLDGSTAPEWIQRIREENNELRLSMLMHDIMKIRNIYNEAELTQLRLAIDLAMTKLKMEDSDPQ